MVKISANDFNREMGKYIDKRRSEKKTIGSLNIKLPFEKKPAKEEIIPDIGPSEVHVEYKEKRPNKLSKLFSFRRKLVKEASNSEDLTPEEMAKLRDMEDDIELTEKEIIEKEDEIKEIREEEKELVEKRENMLTKFFGSLNILKRRPMKTVEVPEEEFIDEPVLDQDVAEVLKITHKWIEQLTPAKKRSFKASKDFQSYKAVLEKYGLIRKK